MLVKCMQMVHSFVQVLTSFRSTLLQGDKCCANAHPQDLAMACMSHVPAQRPTFVEIVPRVEAMLEALSPEERGQPVGEASSDDD